MIKPPPDDVITTWEQLENNNFTLISFQSFDQDIISNIVHDLLRKGRNQKSAQVAKRLLEKSIQREGEMMWYFNSLLVAEKAAAMVRWPWALHHVGWGESRNSKLKNGKRRCNVGKELISATQQFVLFLPPGSKQLAKVYEYLRASGIVERWHEIDYTGSGSRFALSAQEWIRVKGKTIIV